MKANILKLHMAFVILWPEGEDLGTPFFAGKTLQEKKKYILSLQDFLPISYFTNSFPSLYLYQYFRDFALILPLDLFWIISYRPCFISSRISIDGSIECSTLDGHISVTCHNYIRYRD